jgi:hypothetical protein
MLYKPAELAEELGIPQRTLYDWFKIGAPHQRDGSNHLWVEGTAFAGWVKDNRRKKASPHKLLDSQAYCLHCKEPVNLLDSVSVPGKGRLYYIKGTCPKCSNIIVRGGSKNDLPL